MKVGHSREFGRVTVDHRRAYAQLIRDVVATVNPRTEVSFNTMATAIHPSRGSSVVDKNSSVAKSTCK